MTKVKIGHTLSFSRTYKMNRHLNPVFTDWNFLSLYGTINLRLCPVPTILDCSIP